MDVDESVDRAALYKVYYEAAVVRKAAVDRAKLLIENLKEYDTRYKDPKYAPLVKEAKKQEISEMTSQLENSVKGLKI